MMAILFAAPIVAAPFVVAWYYQRAAVLTRRASPAWDKLEQSARVLLEDSHVPARIGDLVETVVKNAGNGLLTFLALWVIFFGRSKKRGQ